ncbi:MAG TPA: aminodeoxychorismate lyase [Burkholderiales bacterium]|nr:aminodeoxychorismate lyase [Burkholderiales bacterium]
MTLVNGAQDACIAPMDRGLAYGDGVFRTLAVAAGVPRVWPLHYAKLAADCAAIGIACPDEDLLRNEVLQVCESYVDCAIKVIVSRGQGDRGYRYTVRNAPTRVVLRTALPDYPEAYAETGVRVRLCTLRLAQQPALAGVKHLNRLENVLARAEWSDESIAEGLLRDADGNVIGGTMTNAFVATRGILFTPKLERCGVAGVTRERVIRAAAKHGVPCEIIDIAWADVLQADELVLVNSLAGAWPVCELDGQLRSAGPFSRLIQTWLKQDDA